MKYLIVGLGNPGEKYQDTRHNIGFKILDAFANASGIFFAPDRHVDIATAKYKGRTLIMIKPTTFMNLSGKAVNYWMQKEKISPENLLVLVDDIALPYGTIRVRGKGSDGGHNGLKDIQEVLGNTKYPRLRFGIGGEFSKGQQVDYVLGEWSLEEQDALPAHIERSINAIQSFCTIGLNKTMTVFNKSN